MDKHSGYLKVKANDLPDAICVNRPFNSENDMCDAVQNNLQTIMDIYDAGKIQAYHREKVVRRMPRGKRISRIANSRADFIVDTQRGSYVLEVKNPSAPYVSLRDGIAQCLDYWRLLSPERVILVSSVFSSVVPEMILFYNLPIDFVLFTPDFIGFMDKEESRYGNA